ncbi:MAG TPA: hypothetical protein VH763_05075 [Gemmatimonadales bacterium]|jgi:uncharacterized repeat protein (TIGR01451 family)
MKSPDTLNAIARLGTLTVLLGSLTWVTGQAQLPAQPQALVLVAHNLMAGDSAHRALARHGRDSSTVLAGDLLRYDLRFTNLLRDSVQRVTFDNPLPPGMHYVAQSAGANRRDAVVEFSIDGGRTYSAKPMIEREVNGHRIREPAPEDSYTHVRWRIAGWVQPGVQVTAQFRARYNPGH